MLRLGATTNNKEVVVPENNRTTVELIRDAYGWAQAAEPAEWGRIQQRENRKVLMIRASIAIILAAAVLIMLLAQSH